MIDLHCHILHGMDDGPETFEESVGMCRMALKDGISIIVATPHFRPGMYESFQQEKHNKSAALNDELKRLGITVKILVGGDVTVTPELPRHLSADPSLYLNGTGKYFLAELPHDAIPANWDSFLLSLRCKGITPIITHPERNRWFLNHSNALAAFVMSGGMVQITAMSITGAMGKEVQEYCRFLLRSNLVHVIATDAHAIDQRPPLLSEAVAEAVKIIGRERAMRLVNDIPQAIIEGRTVDFADPIIAAPEKKWFQRLLNY